MTLQRQGQNERFAESALKESGGEHDGAAHVEWVARVGLLDQGICRPLRCRDPCGFFPNRFAARRRRHTCPDLSRSVSQRVFTRRGCQPFCCDGSGRRPCYFPGVYDLSTWVVSILPVDVIALMSPTPGAYQRVAVVSRWSVFSSTRIAL